MQQKSRAPDRGGAKCQQKTQAGNALAARLFAPSLEHGQESNHEQSYKQPTQYF